MEHALGGSAAPAQQAAAPPPPQHQPRCARCLIYALPDMPVQVHDELLHYVRDKVPSKWAVHLVALLLG